MRSICSRTSVAGNGDAWACGGSFLRTRRPLVLRWNGRAWRTAATPVRENVELESITAASQSQVWAVGDATSGSSPRSRRPYTLRWNGHSWQSVAVPDLGPAHDGRQLNSIAHAGGRRLVAVGADLGPTRTGALYARWDGYRWSVVLGPVNGTFLNAVSAGGATLWAVGATDTSAGKLVPIVQRSH
jgi:hypothetical protein